MKTYNPIQVIDIRFRFEYLIPKKIMLFEEYDENPTDSFLYVISKKLKGFLMEKNTGVELS